MREIPHSARHVYESYIVFGIAWVQEVIETLDVCHKYCNLALVY